MKLLLILLCLTLMVIFIVFEKKEKYLLAVILKGLASCMFVLLGLWCSRVIVDPRFVRLVRIGLILGLIADILLNLRFVIPGIGKIIFLFGILVFLAGHIFYICALVPTVNSILFPVVVGVVVSTITLKLIFDTIEAQTAFKIFGIFYIGTIVIMNCFAICNFIQDPSNMRYILFMIGAILFFVSDVVLILNTFGKTTRFSLRVTNLTLYYLGQMFIALSMLFPLIAIA